MGVFFNQLPSVSLFAGCGFKNANNSVFGPKNLVFAMFPTYMESPEPSVVSPGIPVATKSFQVVAVDGL